jgi:hypothetical protein
MLIRYWSLTSKSVVTKAIAFLHSDLSLNQTTMALQLRKGIINANLDEALCIARHHDTLVNTYYLLIFLITTILILFLTGRH